MDAARWERIQTLFHDTAERPPAERSAFLEAAAGGDRELVEEVAALIQEDARGGSVLDRDASAVAGQMLGGEEIASAQRFDQRFGPYRLVRPLGEGGMGVVYLAKRDDLASHAAIKILRHAWMSAARRERFASEQRMLAQLNHPSIARIYDADTLDDGTPWFAMEYV